MDRQPSDLAPLLDANARWHRTLVSMSDAEYAAPSALPGWTRAHVVAHVTLNGEAFLRVLRQSAAGEAASMYDTAESRDLDIDARSAASPAELRRRSHVVDDDLVAALRALPVAQYDVLASRLPHGGGFSFPLHEVAPRRLGEVEIHHVDLGLPEVTQADWPLPFAESIVHSRAGRHPDLTFLTTDTGLRWGTATSAVLISGSTADLAWWLTGRAPRPGQDSGLTSSTGSLPPAPSF